MAEPPKPPPDDEAPRASFTDDDRDFPMPHESRSWITGRKRKFSVLRVDPDTLPKSKAEQETPPEPPEATPAPSEQTDVEKATDAANDALTERNKQSPAVQKAIADEVRAEAFRSRPPDRDLVSDLVDGIHLRRTEKLLEEVLAREKQANQPPQAYRTPIEMLKAAAIAEAEEEARQRVRQKYRRRQRPEREDLVAEMLDSNAASRRELAEQAKVQSSKPPEPSQPEPGSGFGLWSQRIWKDDVKPLFKATPTWIKWAIGLFLFGLTMIQIAEYLFALLSFIASGVFFALWIASWDGWPNRSGVTKLVKAVLLSFIVGGFVVFTLILISIKGSAPWSHLTRYAPRYFRSPVISTPSPSPLPSSSEPKTSYEYFRSDDFDLMTMRNTGAVSVKKETVIIERKLIVDLNGKSEFLAFYIPPDRTYDVCSALLDQYPLVIKFFHESVALQSGTMGSRPTDLSELAFTGRIFFYYDGLLFQSKVDLLVSKAARKHLSLQFRGPDYVMVRTALSMLLTKAHHR